MDRHFGVWFHLIGFVAMYAVLISCDVTLSKNDESKDYQEGFAIVKKLANDFSINFFSNITLWQPKSLVVSPLSFFLVLSMLSYGADGPQKASFLKTIGLRDDQLQLALLGYEELLSSLSLYNVRISTKMYYASDLTLSREFTELATNVFRADLETVNADEEYISPDRINDWIKQQTNNECTNLFKVPLIIGPQPSVFLLSTIHLKRSWKRSFDYSATELRPFYRLEDEPVNVPTMRKLVRLPHGKIDSIRASFVELELATNGDDNAMSMFVVLPDEEKTTAEIINDFRKLNPDELSKSNEKLVDIYLPKFQVEHSERLTNEKLNAIVGEHHPYKGETSMANLIEGQKSIFFNHGFVKSSIEINELGITTGGLSNAFYGKKQPDDSKRYTRSTNKGVQVIKFDANRTFIVIVATKGKMFLDVISAVCNGYQAKMI